MTPIFRHFAILAAVSAAPAAAQGFEDLDQLETQVTASLGAGIGELGGPARPIDRRLKLRPCPQPPTVEEPAMGAVAVRCEAIGWRIRVPLTAGSAVARAASAPARSAEPVVRRGDQVQLVALTRSFSVSTFGIAEQDGAPGDRIRVRREVSDRRGDAGTSRIIGEILPDGRVALPGFN
ncbi:flagella basal body P-ring formation protein FlgA [Sphingosinicella sp. CPCC 101087]|uniref:flagella basal body P-ring formation protein FlgA n=1 Tax=Sphingosinicella sp. CPCC 101087 TaxID=2497754 RepID=UPI00101C018E|nr:flagella basal body P-ring formation protein FlgA [Sphingosinicella sp. CPCC 101087]